MQTHCRPLMTSYTVCRKMTFVFSLHNVIVSLALSQHTEGFKKRWFTMDDRRLMYFKDPLVRRHLRPMTLPFVLTDHLLYSQDFLSLFLSPRMPMPVVRCSSVVRRTATLSCPACPHPHRATTGTMASPSSRQTGSSCLPVRLRPSNGIG